MSSDVVDPNLVRSCVSGWRTVFPVGRRSVLAVSDGVMEMPEGFLNRPGFQHHFADASGVPRLPVASFVVPGEVNVLVDAGFGPRSVPSMTGGFLLDELAGVGFAPRDIGVVALSHLHTDHYGWLVNLDGRPTFPEAEVVLGRGDYDFFVLESGPVPPRSRLPETVRDALAELHRIGRVRLIDRTGEIAAGMVALPAPGHTPGHTVFAVRDGDARLLLLGDAMYCPEQLTDLDLRAVHDIDPVLARQTRRLIRSAAEVHGAAVVGCHFPQLRVGRVLTRLAE
jgi:glyoxylase-like metal-dependent hydrolase (beta-lactamase superfamily II)